MSDSRLEKFIYAICSMDVSDLPVPLSRIEKLWNCLITGETPDFEPLSRNEKYLMAMLDRYDISNLPAPMSRGEKLLYKIAVGETDLSDVPGYLSRYEELLKYLIENGGVGGGDFEYVLYTINQSLYTLYTTAEKPVKSAILKGNTLVNLSLFKDTALNVKGVREKKCYNKDIIKPNTNYLISYNVVAVSGETVMKIDGMNVGSFPTELGKHKMIVRTISNLTTLSPNNLWITSNSNSIEIDDFLIIEYQDGMENWDIPYFEGMQSVKMPVLMTTGKNLLNRQTMSGGYIDESGILQTNTTDLASDYIRISPNTNYTYKVFTNAMYGMRFTFFDENKSMIKRTDSFNISNGGYKTYTSPSGAYYVRTHSNSFDAIGFDANISLVMGDTPLDTYEPYKSNILTVNEPIELRGIGDVKDTLDCLTGEVTERIGEYTIDGSEDWKSYDGYTVDGYKSFIGTITGLNNTYTGTNAFISGDLKMGAWSDYMAQTAEEMVWNHDPNKIGIKVKNETASNVEELKTFLTANPITFQYELATEVIKTVDLTVLNQDNQPTELGTFENVTYVSLESAGLIPEVEMEVATNLLEDTVFNLTSAFNTLYPTAAKPVVDGTLYGQTLVNVALKEYMEPVNNASINGETITLDLSQQYSRLEFSKDNSLLIPNEVYTCILYDVVGDITNVNFSAQNENSVKIYIKDAGYKFTFTMGVGKNGTNRLCYIENKTATSGTVSFKIVLLKGDYTNVDIPYFTGMQSVKMPVLTTTGKNLFDGKFPVNSGPYVVYPVEDGTYTFSITDNDTSINVDEFSLGDIDKNGDMNSIRWIFDEGKYFKTNQTFTNRNLLIYPNTEEAFNKIKQRYHIQIEKGETATTYEPYKTNILSASEYVELRGIGEVQDEVNVMTGEVVERIGEIVLDSNMNWQEYNTNVVNTYCGVIKDGTISDYKNTVFRSDKLTQLSDSDIDSEGIRLSTGKNIYVRLNRNKGITDLTTFKQYLSQNPITVQYEIETSTTKTVDLSIVNQDGNITELKTFNNTTNVLLESEGLIPTAALTVRTKIPSASSTSLLMDDISTEQQQLETTVDEQSNNVDATMIATTEIYEETL